MARKMYLPKSTTTNISADIKMTVKIADNYYSVTGHEERSVPASDEVELDKEWEFLYDELYDEVASQIQQIKDAFKKRK